MDTRKKLDAALEGLARTVATLDLSDPKAATQQLETSHPHGSLGEIRDLLSTASKQGWLTPREATPTLKFGRLAKPGPDSQHLSIDAVDIQGEGAEHTHPEGEVSLCFAVEGEPRFDGHPEGWVVYGPDSHHTPTVLGGRMRIIYFQPNGAVKWGPREG